MPQENNMAEVVRLLHTVIGKVDGLATTLTKVEADVQILKTDVQILKTNVERIDLKIDRVDGKLDTVVEKTMGNTQRIINLEYRVDALESKAA